ncbi:MAG: glutathione S-transferase family protein [bacterium]
MLTIYGNEVSSPCNKVRFVANALGLPYEYKHVDLRGGENKFETFLKLNPSGKVPVIVDDGFSLFESNAIIKYLSEKAGSPLYPKDLRQRVTVDQWMDFSSLHIGTAMQRVFVNRVLYQFVGMEKDERSLKDGIDFLGRFLPVVEGQLKNNKFIAGPEMTVADFCLLAHLDPAEISQVDLSAYSSLTRWRNGLKDKEFYQKCFPSYEQMLMKLAAK